MGNALLEELNFQPETSEDVDSLFKEGIEVVRDNLFRITNPNVSTRDNIIYSQDVKQIDVPMDDIEIMNAYPAGKDYMYTKISDNKNIKITLLRYKGDQAFFSTGRRGFKVKISNLEKRLTKISDKIVFPDFGENKSSHLPEEMNFSYDEERKAKVINFDDKNINPRFVKDLFLKYSNIGSKESDFLLSNKFKILQHINTSLHSLKSVDSLNTENLNFILPVSDFRDCFKRIMSINEVSIRDKAVELFRLKYIDFLKIRLKFILDDLFIIENLNKLFGEDLFKLIDYYDYFDNRQKNILTTKIKNDISFYIDSYKGTNEILIQRLKNFLEKISFTKDDVENIYELSMNK